MLDPWSLTGGRWTTGAALGGGSSAPAWPAAGSLVDADFGNSRYALDGETVLIDDVLVEDLDWSLWDGTTAFSNTNAPTFASAVAVDLLSGATFVCYFAITDRTFGVSMSSTDYSSNVEVDINLDGVGLWKPSYLADVARAGDPFTAAALTITPTKLAGAGAGETVVSGALDPARTYDRVSFYGSGPITVDRMIVFPPQPDEDLPGLPGLYALPLPAWIVDADFAAGTYELNGEAAVLADILTELWEDTFPGVTPGVGIGPSSPGLALSTALYLTSQGTLILLFTMDTSDPTSSMEFHRTNEDFSPDWQAGVQPTGAGVADGLGGVATEMDGEDAVVPVDGANILALTYTETGIVATLNGEPIVSLAGTPDPEAPFTTLYFTITGSVVLTGFRALPPVPNGVLPTLSALPG